MSFFATLLRYTERQKEVLGCWRLTVAMLVGKEGNDLSARRAQLIFGNDEGKLDEISLDRGRSSVLINISQQLRVSTIYLKTARIKPY